MNGFTLLLFLLVVLALAVQQLVEDARLADRDGGDDR
jgi:hypothetical protein